MVRPLVLTIAGLDPSCGAGLAADLDVFSAFGCRGAAAAAGLTAQGSLGVAATAPVPDGFVAAQLEAILADGRPAAVKTGMLLTGDAVRAVVTLGLRLRSVPLVVDPVLASSGGVTLCGTEAASEIAGALLPLATVLTPNAGEAAALTGAGVTTTDAAVAAGRTLLGRGARAVLVKGGHLPGDVVTDVLVLPGGTVLSFERPRIRDGRLRRGTGCALSAAIAACLARGMPLGDAVRVAGDFVHEAIARAFATGGGALTLDRSVRVAGMPS